MFTLMQLGGKPGALPPSFVGIIGSPDIPPSGGDYDPVRLRSQPSKQYMLQGVGGTEVEVLQNFTAPLAPAVSEPAKLTKPNQDPGVPCRCWTHAGHVLEPIPDELLLESSLEHEHNNNIPAVILMCFLFNTVLCYCFVLPLQRCIPTHIKILFILGHLIR
jgi:hypothetical protein